jgi:hypothetical protein
VLGLSRDALQNAARIGALAFVIVWLFSARLQGEIPFWLPFAVLATMEVELLVRGLRESRSETAPRPVEKRLPGSDDADLGWIETVDEEGEPILVAAPPRARRRSRVPMLVVLVGGVALFAYAYRVDREAGWMSLSQPERAKAQQRFTAEAARIAGKPVRVLCDEEYAFTGTGSDAAGVAFIPRGVAYLEPTVCRSLFRIAFEHRVGGRDDAAFAITVLAHEATHLRGVSNEAEAECYALQEGVGLAERLGLSPGTARDLMRAQLDRDLSDATIQRVDYRLPPGCRNGGSLDLRPGDSSFP